MNNSPSSSPSSADVFPEGPIGHYLLGLSVYRHKKETEPDGVDFLRARLCEEPPNEERVLELLAYAQKTGFGFVENAVKGFAFSNKFPIEDRAPALRILSKNGDRGALTVLEENNARGLNPLIKTFDQRKIEVDVSASKEEEPLPIIQEGVHFNIMGCMPGNTIS